MEKLEEITHPQPLADFLNGSFVRFRRDHPWVGGKEIGPKSIAREMFESFWSFSDYVREYEIERAEGLLLRHLNSVYKVLAQTVPDGVKSDAVREMEIYLRTMLRDVDSSLLEEWERMKDPSYTGSEARSGGGLDMRPPGADAPPDVTRDTKSFTAAIRTRVFAFIRAWSVGGDEAALAVLASPLDDNGEPWTTDRLKAAREAHRVEHKGVRLDPEARNLRHTHVKASEDGASLRVQQMLIDTEGANDWVAEFEVNLGASREANDAVLRLARIEPFV